MGEQTELITKRRAPTLYVIIAIKLLKGALFITLAIMLYCLSDNDLPAELKHWLHVLRFNPERRFWTELAKQIAQVSESNVLWAAAGTLVYSLFSVVEGVGLIFRVSWAGWMAIGESAFFIPIEIFELLQRPHDPAHRGHPVMVTVILAINIFIVVYLYRNKERLFRHHHHH